MSTPPQSVFMTRAGPESAQISAAAWIGTGILALLAVLGVALRLREYWFNRSLWVDEAAFALNVINRDFASLLSDQTAPPGFLLATFSAVAAFGPGELALRLTPLIAGLLFFRWRGSLPRVN